MSNPYGQIFLTYARRKMFWFWGGIALCASAGMLELLFDIHRSQQPGHTALPNVGFSFPLMYCFAVLIIHLKQQIATPYASLIPNYRAPQLLIAAIMSAPSLLLLPLIVSLGAHLPFLPLLSLNVALCALLAWAVYRNSFPLMAIVLACWFSPALPAVDLFLTGFLTDASWAYAPLSLLILAAGIVGFIALAHRLLHLSEEMPEYSRNISTSYWDTLVNLRSQRPTTQINFQSRWAMFFVAPSDSQLARIAATPHPNFWQRVARWRAAQGNRRGMALMALVFLLTLFILRFNTQDGTFRFAWMFFFIFPISAVLGQLLRRLPLLGSESLRPVSRRNYLIENALASALQLAELWLLMAALLLLQIAWLFPASLYTPIPWLTLGAVALFQIFFLAIGFWLLRFRSPLLLWSCSFGSIAVFPMLAIFSQRAFPFSPATASLIAALVLLVSLLIFLDAYRRWLKTDLG